MVKTRFNHAASASSFSFSFPLSPTTPPSQPTSIRLVSPRLASLLPSFATRPWSKGGPLSGPCPLTSRSGPVPGKGGAWTWVFAFSDARRKTATTTTTTTQWMQPGGLRVWLFLLSVVEASSHWILGRSRGLLKFMPFPRTPLPLCLVPLLF